MEHDTRSKHVYLNVTEIRGMPLIIIEAYQALFIILIVVFIRWVVFAVEHTCKQTDNQGEIIPTAHPVRRVRDWVSETFSPTTRRSSSYFSQDSEGSSVETKDDDPEIGSPTAAAIRPTEGLDSNE